MTIVLFDGVCNFCTNFVQFLIRHDHKKVFHFASLQSEVGKKILLQHGLDPNSLNTSVLIAEGKSYLRSAAGLRILKLLGGGWQFFYVLIFVPAFVRDGVYGIIARNRYRWFGRREQCIIPTEEVKDRFLDLK